MATETDTDEPRDLIRRLFYLITALCEDAAGHASEGQGREVDDETIIDLADRLHTMGQTLTILTDVIKALKSREI